ncbi:MAG: hypothetical protein CFE44_21240 [Burkholderiales bacterium PBB4]|nr:MAG: hypothetical protein CFE44_21240 [Burkholderiales bacterium PBB4]
MLIFTVIRDILKFKRKASKQSFPPTRISPHLPKLSNSDKDKVNGFFHPLFWFSNSPDTVSNAAKKIIDSAEGGYHFGDNFLTWGKSISMLDDESFVKAWKSNVESTSDETIIWRRYVLACAAYHCVQLEGDFVECGAYTGVGIKTVIDYLGGVDFPKTFWGYDLFEHHSEMLNHAMPEHGPELFDRIKLKFKNYPQVNLVKGTLPEALEIMCPEKIAFLHIDLNQGPAEIAVLEQLFDKITFGGILILDDYDWAGVYREQKIAEDKWLEARGYRVMPLPTGQGLVIKR